jgi:hypothetical protein
MKGKGGEEWIVGREYNKKIIFSTKTNAFYTFSRIPWHPAFVEAMQMELREYRDILEFHSEFQLTTEPLRIDCVVIRKTKDVEIKKNIAAIFRDWNLLEYKSPGDYVSIGDFYKVYGYACLYTSLQKVPIQDLSISFVESRHPKKLLKHLRDERGYTIAETAEGIYTINSDIIPIQIIDNRKLSADENLWLKSLSDELDSSEVTRIGVEIIRHEKAAQIEAYRNVITEANSGSIEEALAMKQKKKKITLEQVMINCGLAAKLEAKGRSEGKAEGGAEKAFSIAQNMVNLGLPLETVVSATQLEPEKVKSLYRK